MKPLIYMDHAATSPLKPEVLQAMQAAPNGNASSVHAMGRKAKSAIEDARTIILNAVGAGQQSLVFTGSGTEANALGLNQAKSFARLLVGAAEHDSILMAARQYHDQVFTIPLSPDGPIDLAALKSLLMQSQGPSFVCVQWANAETGILNDMKAIAALVREHLGWLHVDAIQALGKISIDFTSLGCHSLSLSAHKIGGPQGIGALVYERGLSITPLIWGGGQEQGLRSGTENIAGIVGFAAAIGTMHAPETDIIEAQSKLEDKLISMDAEIIGKKTLRVANIMALAQPHWSSALQLMHMDLAGFCVSSGSACSSGKVKPSNTLMAMGRPEIAGTILRLSFGWTTKASDLEAFYSVWADGYKAFMARQSTLEVHH